jgi:hypothetical protein
LTTLEFSEFLIFSILIYFTIPYCIYIIIRSDARRQSN